MFIFFVLFFSYEFFYLHTVLSIMNIFKQIYLIHRWNPNRYFWDLVSMVYTLFAITSRSTLIWYNSISYGLIYG